MPTPFIDGRESPLATSAFYQADFRTRFVSSVALLSVIEPVLEARNAILSSRKQRQKKNY